MKFKIKIKDKNSDYERIEEYDSNNLFWNGGRRTPKRIPFAIKEDSKEEFERFAKALIENFNIYCHPDNQREFVEIIMD